ncbi:hypothetical protein [Blastococcus sp. PRF04-17]|uniref:hypothetical protein n=1 Tax=Blastococcus sp. PRF04-17 TaxID=2933797 RepID=UPI001FF35651|nr:hypothetical protein [Blastococcus sp. PRF04-17]UOY03896.1 hypothetical protein MVA48_11470 [Blastococcus sp. PRF04-17]
MAQPTTPPDGGTPAPEPSHPPYDGGVPIADGGTVWTAPPAPSWTTPWPPPGEAPAAPIPPAPSRKSVPRGPVVLALVALAGVLAGAVGAAFLVTAVFLGSAQDIGREIAAEVGPEVAREAGDGVVDALGEMGLSMLGEGFADEEFGGPMGEEMPPVEQHPAVEPGELGPDPVLNQYAVDCFGGDLQSCDDLMYESPPLSDYEQYGLTCGGRVKAYMVMYCTELE